ncbi:MAG: bifunctional pyr operon transcriptional regulator/uracil phosphoribosyltransferase PyrR [Gammaproteobacteria bacterium]|nr:bifunctional pyr operon transcriptional regulator/uracil phosphoribosyltransferase PyrR [Gammaproteobacteria bacterium]
MNSPIEVLPLISQMSKDISQLELEAPLFIGIHSGGVWIAEKIYQELAPAKGDIHEVLGTLDISLHRDDFMRVGMNVESRSSKLPQSIDDRNIVLIDDVLHSGRTVRAAMNEIFSYGRPATIKLAVLIDREERELPIQADVIGCRLPLPPNQQAKLQNTHGELRIDIIKQERER